MMKIRRLGPVLLAVLPTLVWAGEQARSPAVCFGPGTPADYIEDLYTRLRAGHVPSPFQFDDGNRWSATATNGGGLGQGFPTILTWSVVPDGTFIPSAFAGDPAGVSTLRARLDALYGSEATWRPLIQQSLDEWGTRTGTSYVFSSNDDGAALPNPAFIGSPGVLGVRGDVRISGRGIDGAFGILAYNWFPDAGDMVIDAPDGFYNDTSNGSLRFRNVVTHEHGHGLGIAHVCPINQTKLMEPFFSPNFTGVQHDDILAGQRGYGDDREDDDTATEATDFGSVGDGTFTANGGSVDGAADADLYRFTVPAGKQVDVTLTPVGFTYIQGPQNANGTCTPGAPFNSLVQNDVSVQVIGPNGTKVLATASSQPAGSPETLNDVILPTAGPYFIRVEGGTSDQVQLYNLALTVQPASGPFLFVEDGTAAEGDGGTSPAAVTVGLNIPAAAPVTVSVSTADDTAVAPGDYLSATGTLTFPPGTISRTAIVPVVGDEADEPDETFFVNLSTAVGAGIAYGQGIATILDDDLPIVSALSHGYRASANLAAGGGAPDRDTYAIRQDGFASYEVVVDATSGDITPLALERVDAGGATIQGSVPVGSGPSASLRWMNSTSSVVDTETVRVLSGGCSTDCGTDDGYAIRSYETTCTIPRFNNAGSQTTVILLQNPTDGPIAGRIHFWSVQGVVAASQPFDLQARQVLVLNTATLAPGIAGSVTIAHDGRYGELVGKTVALEPATGFSFDSPMQPRAR